MNATRAMCYTVLMSEIDDLEDFERSVNSYIKSGYQLLGTTSISDGKIYQALVLGVPLQEFVVTLTGGD